MKSTFDWPSFLAGAGLAALLGIGLAAAAPAPPAAGRFHAAGADKHFVIVDTVTGQAWTEFVPDEAATSSRNFHGAKIIK